jgi:hypothetical protein
VLWLDGKKPRDADFLKALTKKHPKEVKVLCEKKKLWGQQEPCLSLQGSTRFANNDTAFALQTFQKDEKVMKVIKKVLEHGILNYGK